MVTALVVVLTLAVFLLGYLVIAVLRSHAEILRQLHDLGIGEDGEPRDRTPAVRTRPGVALPRGSAAEVRDLTGVDPTGATRQVGLAQVQHRTLLAFLSSGCLTCREFWSRFGEGDLGLREDIRLVVVTRGPANESPGAVASLAPSTVTTIMTDEAWDEFEVPVAPYFLLVDGPSGRIVGEGAAATWEQVRELMTQALDDAGTELGASNDWPKRPGAMGERDRLVDDALASAGITPGHPSLHPEPHPDAPEPPGRIDGTH